MILPHYFSIHTKGDITLNSEYSKYEWVEITDIDVFEPKISSIPKTLMEVLKIEKFTDKKDFILILYFYNNN